MQDNLVQAQTQAFVKLAQVNMDLLTRLSTSPEVTAQARASASQLFQQASGVQEAPTASSTQPTLALDARARLPDRWSNRGPH